MTVCVNILINNLEKRGGQGVGDIEAVRDSVASLVGSSPVQKEAELKLKRIRRSDESHHCQTQGWTPGKEHSQLLAHVAALSMNWNHWGKRPEGRCGQLDEDICSVCRTVTKDQTRCETMGRMGENIGKI